MASKRITQSAIDWAKMAERVPANQKTQFLAFKARSDSYLRRMMANPEAPPKIDWAFYKARVPIPGMVDNFQKTYESLQIPYPKDTVSSQINAQEEAAKKEIAAFKAESANKISQYRAEIAHISSLIPYEQMTLEELMDAHPECVISQDKPSYWPHNPEEQLDYKDDESQAPSH